MTSYLETDITVDGALKFDPKQVIMADPQQPTPTARTEIWAENTAGVWYFDSDEIFNQSWINYVNQALDISVSGVYIFYRTKGYQHGGAHIDSYPVDGQLAPVSAAYNWVLDYDSAAEMIWYEPWWDANDPTQARQAVQGKISHPNYQVERVDAGTMSYQETPVEYLTEREAHSLRDDVLTVCRTDIPHNVRAGAKDRWCMSLRTYPVLHSWNVYNR